MGESDLPQFSRPHSRFQDTRLAEVLAGAGLGVEHPRAPDQKHLGPRILCQWPGPPPANSRRCSRRASGPGPVIAAHDQVLGAEPLAVAHTEQGVAPAVGVVLAAPEPEHA